MYSAPLEDLKEESPAVRDTSSACTGKQSTPQDNERSLHKVREDETSLVTASL